MFCSFSRIDKAITFVARNILIILASRSKASLLWFRLKRGWRLKTENKTLKLRNRILTKVYFFLNYQSIHLVRKRHVTSMPFSKTFVLLKASKTNQRNHHATPTFDSASFCWKKLLSFWTASHIWFFIDFKMKGNLRSIGIILKKDSLSKSANWPSKTGF